MASLREGGSVSVQDDELRALIAEQERDMRTGHRVFSVSLDAVNQANGFGDLGAFVVPGDGSVGRLVKTGLRTGHVLANDPVHGTVNGYSNLRCRCAKCREAWRMRHYAYRLRGPGPNVRHGTQSTYKNFKCRCYECRQWFYRRSKRSRVKHGRRWTPQLIVCAIQTFHAERGELPTANCWKKSTGQWPSYNAVCRHFGSWANAVEEAGFTRPRQGLYDRAGKKRGAYRRRAVVV